VVSILDPRIVKVTDYIRNHPAERLSQEAAAQMAGVTPAHFRTLFRSVIGRSFREFTLCTRLEHAQVLLAETEWGVQEIAYSLGYNDVYLFSRQFKEQLGLSPSEWRHHHLRSSLMEGRIVFEQGVVEMVCTYATVDDLTYLDKLVAKMACVKTFLEATHLDSEYHQNLVQATHNAAIKGLQSLINSFFTVRQTDLPQLLSEDGTVSAWNSVATDRFVRQHKTLTRIMYERDVAKARLAIRNHILTVEPDEILQEAGCS
jgi:AraC-like DNA-binding protein